VGEVLDVSMNTGVAIFLSSMFALAAVWTFRMIQSSIGGSAPRGVKVVQVTDTWLIVDIGTVRYHYVVDRPKPLTSQDMCQLMMTTHDATFASEILSKAMDVSRRSSWAPDQLFQRFFHQLRKRDTNIFVLNTAVLNYIKDNAVPVDIDGEQCLVITPSVLTKLERGNFGKV